MPGRNIAMQRTRQARPIKSTRSGRASPSRSSAQIEGLRRLGQEIRTLLPPRFKLKPRVNAKYRATINLARRAAAAQVFAQTHGAFSPSQNVPGMLRLSLATLAAILNF